MEESADPNPPSPASLPGTATFVQVPDHELIRLIGRGSYGEVWLGRSTLGSYRAIKIVYEKTFRHRRPFEREYNGVKKFEPVSRFHEGLMNILQVGRNEGGGYFYCVMELADDVVSGQKIDPENYSPRTLARELADQKRLPVEECQRIGAVITSALDFMHARGLIHRDIKPSNIVFVNDVPKLADIGLVAEMSEARSYVGTDGFIPPEGPGTFQADIYSFGKVLYEISTGNDRRDYPELPSRLGDRIQEAGLLALNKIILKACRNEPAQRYQTAGAMAADLAALTCVEELPVASSPARARPRRMARVAVAAVCLAVIGGLLPLATRTPPVPVPEGLVAWWKGEGEGKDSVGNHHVVELDGVGFAAGKVGQAFSFDGEAHRVIASNAPAFNFGPGQDFSIEAWIQRQGTDTNLGIMSIVAKEFFLVEKQVVGFEFGMMEGRVAFNMCDSFSNAPAIFSAGPDLRDGGFHHVAVTVRRESRSGGKLYVDGREVLQFDPTNQSGDLSNTEPLRIGHNANPEYDSFFNGLIDEASIYHRALAASEIEAIYHAGGAGKSAGPTDPFNFAPQIEFSPACPPGNMAPADFDGDGELDLAMMTSPPKVCVYRSIGTNGSLAFNAFNFPVSFSLGAGFNNPSYMDMADVDGDGKMDLLAADRDSDRLAVLRNISSVGTLAFAPPIFYATGADPRLFAVGDLDADGRPDVAIAVADGNAIRILRNTSVRGEIGPASFGEPVDLAVGWQPIYVVIGDIDGDGKPDVAAIHDGGSLLSIFRNTSSPGALGADSFAPGFELPTTAHGTCVAIGDMDGDGKADLVCGSRQGMMMSVYRNISNPGFLSADTFAPRVDFPAGSWVNVVALRDLNGDGKAEIVLCGQRPSRFAIYPNLSVPGSFTTNSLGNPVELRAGTNPAIIAIVDLNENQQPAILVANVYSRTISLFQKRRPAGSP